MQLTHVGRGSTSSAMTTQFEQMRGNMGPFVVTNVCEKRTRRTVFKNRTIVNAFAIE